MIGQNIHSNVVSIKINNQATMDQEYNSLMSEFKRLTKINSDSLSTEENILLQMLELLISSYQEDISLTQNPTNFNQRTSLLAA